MENTYHGDVGFPKLFAKITGTLELEPTKHAQREAKADNYGSFELPEEVTITEEMYDRDPQEAVGETTEPHVVEFTLDGGRIKKIGVRYELNERRDVTLMILPNRGSPEPSKVKTAWTNLKNDNHDTLDRSRYARPK